MIAREVYEAAEAAYDHAIAVAGVAVFDMPNPSDRYLMCYFATAIEQTGGSLALAREGQITSIPILARSILEAWIDFRCLAADASYVDYIEAKHDKEWEKVFDAAENNNIYLAELGGEPLVNTERVRICRETAARSARGVHPLKAYARFQRANKAALYYSVYNHLCAEAHNDARALTGRHLDLDEDNRPRLTLYRDDAPYVETSLLAAHDILSEMTETVCARFNVQEPDRARVQASFEAAQRLVAGRQQ
jgi:Family of unknown function (DUF5677)